MRRGTNMPAVSQFNQTVILDLIRRSPNGISRAELAQRVGLSGQTASNVARRLLDDGLIEEAGTHINGRGKPPVIMKLIPDSRFAVGVHLDPAYVTYVLLNIAGDVVEHRRTRTPSVMDPSTVVAAMADEVRALVDASGLDRSRLVGIGIAAPGPVDRERGIILDPPLLEGWRDVALRDELATLTKLPVLLEKDVNVAAVAEIWAAGGAARNNFGFFYYGSGLGLGLAIDGEVRSGSSGNAGNAGAVVVPAAGIPNRSRSDMLGHIASPAFLVTQAVEEGVLAAGAEADIDASFDELVALATARDEGATRIIARAAENIAEALVVVINLLDLDVFVFGGPFWTSFAPLALEEIGERLNTSPHRMTHLRIRVETSSLGDDVVAIGAAALVLDSVLSPRPSALMIAES
ncbi:hypothetical protein ASE14_11410 [Agromyces sp. Root81]|uniref:ROK family transcriptional regulator n=1 Tax=Agromyces sp. Root81 TaxID=1736601 RepID=UPI0006F5FAEB|nr:ROK family transcriptional regulator [Agromyces sp. Root81]KRC61465.1 hypothetical protein ASE14_11410 [Agromyces sp. Root81]